METAKVFNSGGSQAVRLPKEFRFPDGEVYIKKVGDAVVLYPKQSIWESFMKGVNGFSDDFMENGRDQGISDTRDAL
jgi:Virulence-associated protein and related proteins